MKFRQAIITLAIKCLIAATILFPEDSICQNVEKQLQLAKLPLGIELGITKISLLESRGVTIIGFNSKDSARNFFSRCQINNNQFYGYINLSNIVERISFQAIAQHQLPQNWKNAGLRLARRYRFVNERRGANNKIVDSVKERGNTIEEFLQIISETNAREIKRKITYQSDNQTEETITFEVGNYLFLAAFVKWSKPYWCKNCPDYSGYDNGLVALDISLL